MDVFLKDEKPMAGMWTGRNWKTIIDTLIANGEILLYKGQAVTGVAIEKDYGLMFKIEDVPQPAKK